MSVTRSVHVGEPSRSQLGLQGFNLGGAVRSGARALYGSSDETVQWVMEGDGRRYATCRVDDERGGLLGAVKHVRRVLQWKLCGVAVRCPLHECIEKSTPHHATSSAVSRAAASTARQPPTCAAADAQS